MPGRRSRGPVTALTVTAALGVAIFFSLYSLIPVTRADTPELGSLYVGTLMALVMGVQVFTPLLVRKLSLRIVLGASVILLGLGALATGLAEHLPVLLLGAVAGGVGFGILIVAGAQGIALLVPPAKLSRELGIYGLLTMAASAAGAPAGVYLAIAVSPQVFGFSALALALIGAAASFGIPLGVEKSPAPLPPTDEDARDRVEASERVYSGRLQPLIGGIPWLVLSFLLLGVMLLSHGLTSLPVFAAVIANPAFVLFFVQAANAVGRWAGGELGNWISARSTVAIGTVTVAIGGALGVAVFGSAAAYLAAVFVGLGAGIVQTVTLHMTMQRMDAGRASVVWNLAVDGGLWFGGVVWGLALATGFVTFGVLGATVLTLLLGTALVLTLRR